MKINPKVIYLALIIVVFAMFFFILFWFQDGQECLQNPLVYGAKKYTEANGEEFACLCKLNAPNSPEIKVTSKNMEVFDPFATFNNPLGDLNISLEGGES